MQERIKAQREQLIKLRDYIDKEIAAYDATLKLYKEKSKKSKDIV